MPGNVITVSCGRAARSSRPAADAAAVGQPTFVTFATIEEIDEVAVAGSVPDKLHRPFLDRGVPLTVVPTSG